MLPVHPRVLLLGVALIAGAAAWPRLPHVASVDAPANLFSAERALVHIRAWAAAPRPTGSRHHAAVVAGAAAELERLGFEVERQHVPGNPPLTNLVAHAPGQPTEGGVWLVAHTDTVPESPGAGDDGLGLGVVMESARTLTRGGVPADLHVLLTDGEELGLLGAIAHVQREGVLPRVVLNIEARGTEGPAYMFQLAGNSTALLEVWRQSGCTAQATSLARAVYDLLPSDTDFTVFRHAGFWGYDFALIGGAHRYHSPEDTPVNLDARSVQQVGNCVTGLARGWLGRPMEEAGPTSRVYFQVPGATVVLPPWVVQLLGAGALLTLPRPRSWAALAGARAWIGAVVIALVAGFGIFGIALATRHDFWDGDAEMAGAAGWYLAAGTIGGLITCTAARFGTRRANPWGWHAALVALAAGVSLLAPTAGYVLVPGAFTSALLARGRPVLAAIPAAVAGILLTPLLYAIFPALTTRMLPLLTVVPVLTLGCLLGPIAATRSPNPAGPTGIPPRSGPTTA